jgi:hypothetical protein
MQFKNALTNLGVICTVAGSAGAGSPPLGTIHFRAHGDGATQMVVSGEWVDSTETVAMYVGQVESPEGGWILAWDYLVDVAYDDDQGSFDGAVSVTNLSGTARQYTVSFEVHVDRGDAVSTQIGGQAGITFSTNGDGGVFSGGDALDYIHNFTLDGEAVKQLWGSGTLVELEGVNTATLLQSFGWPFPDNGESGGECSGSVGVCHQFRITSGDTATLQSLLFIEQE